MLKNFRIERITIVIKARIQAGVPYKKLRLYVHLSIQTAANNVLTIFNEIRIPVLISRDVMERESWNRVIDTVRNDN